MIAGGSDVLLIFGAVFNWEWGNEGMRKWAVLHESVPARGCLFWIFNIFGTAEYRIVIGVTDAMIITSTVVYSVLLKKTVNGHDVWMSDWFEYGRWIY